MKRITGIWSVLLSCLFPVCAFAASTSTNFALVEDRFTGGGGAASSTNYQVAETSFEVFPNTGMTSSNYAAEAMTGVSGAADIAVINSVSPSGYAKFYSDSSASYTISAVSQDGDSLQYLAKQDATTKVAAQSSNIVSWALSGSDIGRHTNSLQVIDPQGTTLKQQDAYVVRRPTK